MRKRLISNLLVVAVFGYMGWRLFQDWPQVAGLFQSFNPFHFGLHVLFLALMTFLLALGWHVTMRGLTPWLTFRESAIIWLVPNIGKYTPGKVVMLAGRVGMGLRHGIKEGDCFCALLLEHALVVLASLPFMLWVILQGTGAHAQSLKLMAVAGFAVCAGVVLSINRLQKWLNILLKLFKRQPVEFHFPLHLTLKVFFVYMLSMAAYGLSGWALCKALRLGADLGAFQVVCAFVTAWTVGFLSFLTPGGLGVREGLLVLLLASPASAPQFMAFSILSRLTWIVVELFGALLGLALGKRLPGRRMAPIAPSTPTPQKG